MPFRFLCCFLLTALLVPGPASGQDAAVGQGYWLGGGVGYGGIFGGQNDPDPNRSEALVAAIYGSYRYDAHMLTLRGTIAEELFGDLGADVGLLYARMLLEESGGHLSAGGGLAYVQLQYEDDGLDLCGIFGGDCLDESRTLHTVGLPLEVQAIWRLSGGLGLGIYAFANLNREASFAGLTVSAQLGDYQW